MSVLAAPALSALVERLRDANASRRPLCLRGGGSKDFYGEKPHGDQLEHAVKAVTSAGPQGEEIDGEGGDEPRRRRRRGGRNRNRRDRDGSEIEGGEQGDAGPAKHVSASVRGSINVPSRANFGVSG